MEDQPLEMPFLRNVGLVVTYRCQVACPHCIIEAGPHRKEEVRTDDALGWIHQLAKYREGYVKVLSLTGGEPFYNLTLLKRLAEYGRNCGLFVSAVTNAFWATTPEAALKVIRDFSEIGMFAFSTDVYHQISIPFERVKNAILAARECGIPYNIAVCTENEHQEEFKAILDNLRQITEDETIVTTVTFPAGRALRKIGTLRHQLTSEAPVAACTAGSSPIIFPDGRVIACIGPVIDLRSTHPLVLGSLRESSLEEIFDRAETNAILHAIRIWGPKKLIAMIEEAGLGRNLPEKYIRNSVCNACYSLMENEEIVQFLEVLANDSNLIEKVAYARLYYLNEKRMLELAGVAANLQS